MPSNYAIYRLPHGDHATLIRQAQGEPLTFRSLTALNGREGFVVAPFEVTSHQPIIVIQGERQKVALPTDVHVDGQHHARTDCTDRKASEKAHYADDFAKYHAQLEQRAFRKIVLARCAEETTEDEVDKLSLFYKACELYPRMFIALVETEQCGCWLTATPEILLEGKGADWHTIALAGTMKLEDDQLNGEGEQLTWSTKNIQEQRYVSTYIKECLEQFTDEITEDGPRTVRAANLVHLRSDFTFTLPDSNHLGDVLQALHPTPAVCGLPKSESFQFITKNEHTPRRYYSGFLGPLGEADTHLYVSLRCMNIDGQTFWLYAGSGLLQESDVEQEWQETEAKLETMRQVLNPKYNKGVFE